MIRRFSAAVVALLASGVVTVDPWGAPVAAEPGTAMTELARTPGLTAPVPQASGGLAWTGVTAVSEMIIAGVVVLALGLGLLLFARGRRRDR